ncbi:hypothetical protein BD410DRAFT_789190 [Rickenella mellea]|uniref:Uncharacterized protein n=1 Tax=Rickenella mellea TaxID=50990 RepID=A0A4Y7Q4R2_9AGAM|nr:hypothetical protein BD410DRAFT_789190 [Rickenella mellea]
MTIRYAERNVQFSPIGPPVIQHSKPERPRRSSFHFSKVCKKYISRSVTLAWKNVTQTARKHERSSVLPEGFILINNYHSRRRSVFFGYI